MAPHDDPPRLPIALTMGDPAGIGLEIAVKAWLARESRAIAPFVLLADAGAVRASGCDAAVMEIDRPGQALEVFDRALPVISVPLTSPVRAGAPDPRNAAATIASIELAVAAVARGEACALVTSPIAKSVLYAAGFTHPGHTEFLAELARRHWPGHAWRSVMMLACDELRTVPLSVHVPLAAVPAEITTERILTTAMILHGALRRDFAVLEPRIAVAGLNPHAGEGGSIGTEDRDVIAPAIAELRARGLAVSGPHSADTLFHAAARERYDAVLAMYHDQALIPIKTLAFDRGVNVTLGLPFVRTSPDHGTAFDIAGRGVASPESLIASLAMAARMAAARARPEGDGGHG